MYSDTIIPKMHRWGCSSPKQTSASLSAKLFDRSRSYESSRNWRNYKTVIQSSTWSLLTVDLTCKLLIIWVKQRKIGYDHFLIERHVSIDEFDEVTWGRAAAITEESDSHRSCVQSGRFNISSKKWIFSLERKYLLRLGGFIQSLAVLITAGNSRFGRKHARYTGPHLKTVAVADKELKPKGFSFK